MSNIFRAGNNILRTGTSVFRSTTEPTAIADFNAENIALAAGTAVPIWEDSINSVSAFQNTAANQPLLQVSGGFKEVVFDGSNDHLLTSVNFNVGTLFCVVRSTVVNQGYGSLFGGTPLWTFTGFASSYFGDDSSIPDSFARNPNNRAFANGVRNTPISTLSRNTFYQVVAIDVTDTRTLSMIGCSINLSSGNAPVFFFNGAFRRIIIYRQRLTEIQRQSVIQTLLTQYSL